MTILLCIKTVESCLGFNSCIFKNFFSTFVINFKKSSRFFKCIVYLSAGRIIKGGTAISSWFSEITILVLSLMNL